MREKVCCILDKDEEYAVRLTGYFNDKGKIPYRAMAYTDIRAVIDSLKDYEAEVLITGCDISDTELEQVCVKKLIYLGESSDEDCVVCRYQSADKLMKDVLARLSVGRNELEGAGGTRIIGIYTPSYDYDREQISLGLAAAHGRDRRVLYMNLEEFTEVSQLLELTPRGLSDALFFYLTDPDGAYAKVISCSGRADGYDYMYPVVCAEDIMDITSEELKGFIGLICDGGAYDEIIVDIGTLVRTPWEVMEFCDEILVPQPINEVQNIRLNRFNDFISKTGREKVAGRIKNYSQEMVS